MRLPRHTRMLPGCIYEPLRSGCPLGQAVDSNEFNAPNALLQSNHPFDIVLSKTVRWTPAGVATNRPTYAQALSAGLGSSPGVWVALPVRTRSRTDFLELDEMTISIFKSLVVRIPVPLRPAWLGSNGYYDDVCSPRQRR